MVICATVFILEVSGMEMDRARTPFVALVSCLFYIVKVMALRETCGAIGYRVSVVGLAVAHCPANAVGNSVQ